MFIPLNPLLIIYTHWYKYMCSRTEEKVDGDNADWTYNKVKGVSEAKDTQRKSFWKSISMLGLMYSLYSSTSMNWRESRMSRQLLIYLSAIFAIVTLFIVLLNVRFPRNVVINAIFGLTLLASMLTTSWCLSSGSLATTNYIISNISSACFIMSPFLYSSAGSLTHSALLAAISSSFHSFLLWYLHTIGKNIVLYVSRYISPILLLLCIAAPVLKKRFAKDWSLSDSGWRFLMNGGQFYREILSSLDFSITYLCRLISDSGCHSHRLL